MREEKFTDMSLTEEQASFLGFKSFSKPEQYIQVKDVRYTLDEFNRIGDYLLGRELTDDQQVLLDELKVDQNGWYPFFTIWHLMEEKDSIHMPTKEQFQVLAAFADYGLEANQ